MLTARLSLVLPTVSHRGHALPSIRAAKPITIDGLRLTGTDHLLELGCGTGDDAEALALRETMIK